jgi:hypothetical protein
VKETRTLLMASFARAKYDFNVSGLDEDKLKEKLDRQAELNKQIMEKFEKVERLLAPPPSKN